MIATCFDRRAAALAYASTGVPVFPLGEKTPRIPSDPKKAAAQGWAFPGRGHKDATTEAEVIEAWFSIDPRINIGMPTGPASGLLVVDCDSHDASVRFRAMGVLGAPLIQRTKRGWHLFWRWTSECDGIRNDAGRKLGDGIDVRGDGGFVVIAPSRRRCGFRYTWHSIPDQVSGPPDWLIEVLRPARRSPTRPKPCLRPLMNACATTEGDDRLRALCDQVATAPVGEQEITLNRASWLAGRLAAAGKINASFAFAMLNAAAHTMPDYEERSPWLSAVVARKITRAMEAAL